MNSSSILTVTTLDPSLLKVDLRTIYYLGLAQKLKVFEVHLSLTKMRVKLVHIVFITRHSQQRLTIDHNYTLKIIQGRTTSLKKFIE